jgi:uncharacterized OsmC-like protein
VDPTNRIADAFERNARAIERMPSIAKKTAVSKTRIVEGVRCEVEEGRWKLAADLHEKSGGTGAGPDPGVLGRAAFGSCLAMGVVMWAAKTGVRVSAVSVDVEADFDAGAQYGVGSAPPGYTEVRYKVHVVTDAPEADVRRVVEQAEASSPWHDVFARPQKLVRQLLVTAPQR